MRHIPGTYALRDEYEAKVVFGSFLSRKISIDVYHREDGAIEIMYDPNLESEVSGIIERIREEGPVYHVGLSIRSSMEFTDGELPFVVNMLNTLGIGFSIQASQNGNWYITYREDNHTKVSEVFRVARGEQQFLNLSRREPTNDLIALIDRQIKHWLLTSLNQ